MCTPGRTYSLATRRSRERCIDGMSMFRSRRHADGAVAEIRSWTGRSKMSGVNLSRLSRTATSRSIWSPHSAKVSPEPDLCVFGDAVHPFAQLRELLRDGAGHLLRFLGLLAGQQPGAVPRARGRGAAEAAQLGRAAEPSGQLLAVPDTVQHAALEPDGGGRRRVDGGQRREGLHGLVRRAPPARPDVVQGRDVVHQGVPVLGQGGVQVLQLRFQRLFVADDRPDQLALELQRAWSCPPAGRAGSRAPGPPAGRRSRRGWRAGRRPPGRSCLRRPGRRWC